MTILNNSDNGNNYPHPEKHTRSRIIKARRVDKPFSKLKNFCRKSKTAMFSVEKQTHLTERHQNPKKPEKIVAEVVKTFVRFFRFFDATKVLTTSATNDFASWR
ncbi:MAG: hypothetical protein KF851_19005 [Pirellulaceae bacterium]|nr:hypothetical protein [Pirellulaceae bacterium]